MEIKTIRNEADYEEALAAIDRLMGARADTPDGNALDVLVTLVEQYEAERWPVEAPDPTGTRDQARRHAYGDSSRGWTREELYERGRSAID